MISPASPSLDSVVLVVDDNEANRLLVQDTLEDEGYTVLLCSGGEQALELFHQHQPDVVLLDVRMPGVDGITACERIRATAEGASTPIIFLTALRDVDTFERAVAAGGDDFLTKPLQPAELLRRVQTALKVRRMSTELHELYALLRGQRDDLIRSRLHQERLMAFVVHDLKNPLNSIDLQAQVVLGEPDLPEGARDAAGQIRTEALVLGRMISNLLDLSKSDEGKLLPTRTRLAAGPAIDSVLTELAPDAARHEVALQLTLGVESVFADKDLLRRVLANLVENALRHAPAHSVVAIQVGAYPGGFEVRVVDRGVGVRAEARERIFDAFVQVASDGHHTRGGRGLGLTFCKLAVEAHGGRIWVEDAAPGAAFCFRLPND